MTFHEQIKKVLRFLFLQWLFLGKMIDTDVRGMDELLP